MLYIWKNNQAKETHIGREDEGRGGERENSRSRYGSSRKKGKKKKPDTMMQADL
jgi:hypothetical protein